MAFLKSAKRFRARVSREIYSRVLEALSPESGESRLKEPSVSSGGRKISRLEKPFVIGEIKPASPSQGFISTIDWLKIREAYTHVDAVSVLTEEKYFLGSFFNVAVVSSVFPGKPILGKDFIVSREQIDLLKIFGATNYLVIVDMLEEDEIRFMLNIGGPMEPVFEIRSIRDLSVAEKFKAPVVGVNSRNLRDLSVSMEEIYPLVKRAKETFETVIVESGVSKAEDLKIFSGIADGVLVGTTFMRRLDNVPFLCREIKNILRGLDNVG